MSTQLTDYGWRILKGSVSFDNYGYPEFIEESVIVHGNEDWRDLEFSADFFFQGVDIGLVLRYNSKIGYLCFIASNEEYKLLRVPILSDNDDEVVFGDPYTIQAFPASQVLELDEFYTLKAIISGTNIKCYVDDALVINAEDALYNKGAIGVYGAAGSACYSVSVSFLTPDEWDVVNRRDGDIVDIVNALDGKSYMRITLPTESEHIVGISQLIETQIGQPYTVSFNYGGPQINVSFDGQVITQDDRGRFEHTFIAENTYSEVIIGGMLSGVYLLDHIQVEKKEFATDYTEDTRDDGELTYPANGNIDVNKGTISLWVKPKAHVINRDFFYYGDGIYNCIRIFRDEIGIGFRYGSTDTYASVELENDTMYHIVASWDTTTDTKSIVLVVRKDGDDARTSIEFINGAISVTSKTIHVGNSPHSGPCHAILDDLIIYDRAITFEEIETLYNAVEEPENSGDMLLRAKFNYAIGKFDHSIIELTPPPLPGTPIIVQKEDGTILRKVSFTDPATNEYTTYNQEPFVYDGSNVVRISYRDIDNTYYRTGIYTKSGILLKSHDQLTIEDGSNIILLNEPLDNKYKGQELIVMYQPKDCYAVDFNPSTSNTCRIILGKNDGQPVTITYDANPYVDNKRLAETVELNPLNNPNHTGFMYITQKEDKAEIFRIHVAPDELIANGYDYSIVILEAVDKHRNPVSNVNYVITSPPMYGTFSPYFSPNYDEWIAKKEEYLNVGHSEEEWYANYGYYIGLNERAGRQIYIYKPYQLNPASLGTDEVIENIIIKDAVSGLGTDLSIRLMLKSDYKV